MNTHCVFPGAITVAVPGADLLRGHHGTDARGGQALSAGGQELERRHEEYRPGG